MMMWMREWCIHVFFFSLASVCCRKVYWVFFFWGGGEWCCRCVVIVLSTRTVLLVVLILLLLAVVVAAAASVAADMGDGVAVIVSKPLVDAACRQDYLEACTIITFMVSMWYFLMAICKLGEPLAILVSCRATSIVLGTTIICTTCFICSCLLVLKTPQYTHDT